MIGYPNHKPEMRSILSALGLLLCPYYLFSSGYLYTDIIACFFAFLGFWYYSHNRHFLSGVAFVLGIASRQFILAFPLALAVYELTAALRFSPFLSLFTKNKTPLIKGESQQLSAVSFGKISIRTPRKRNSKMHIHWLAPLVAALSILGWILLFKGLAPASALETKNSLESQLSLWMIEPQNGLYSLTVVGLYFVIPEFILFGKKNKFKLFIKPQAIVYCY